MSVCSNSDTSTNTKFSIFGAGYKGFLKTTTSLKPLILKTLAIFQSRNTFGGKHLDTQYR